MQNKKISCKNLISFAGIGLVALALLFFSNISFAQAADITIQGDRFDASVAHYIFWYDANNDAATPCNTSDGYDGNLKASAEFNGLDAVKNDNAGWLATSTGYTGDTFLYLCQGSGGGGALLASKVFGVTDGGGPYYVDPGWANAGGGVSNALDTKNVVICDELDGTKLSTQSKTVSGTTFSQYYLKGEGSIASTTNNDLYILITDSDSCTFDNGVFAATKIGTNANSDVVHMSFASGGGS